MALFLSALAVPGALGQTAAEEAQKFAKEAKNQQAKAEEAAKKLDCEKPKSADKKALVDAVKKANEAAKSAQAAADKAKKDADTAAKNLDRNPKSKTAKAAKEKADQVAKDAQAAADEAAAAAKAALDQAPGMAAADAIEKELDKADVSGNSKKKEIIDRLKKAAQKAAEANPCDPEEVKRIIRVELEDIKNEVSGNKEMKPWVDSLGDKLKTNQLISLPAGGADALLYTARGTGRTTGHIADLSVFNPSGVPATVALGACFIPSDGSYQPYIVPSVPPVSVAPHSTANIPVYGFCADIFTPPAPAGALLPPVHAWITVAPPVAGWRPDLANGWQPVRAPGSTVLTIPGTDTPLSHTIDVQQYPGEAAAVLLDALNKIATAYDQLKAGGAMTTPFSGNPEKERESVIQQTFWIYAAELSGREYRQADFHKNTVRQYESATGQPFSNIPEEQKKQVEQGVQDFWNAFQATGTEAKILK